MKWLVAGLFALSLGLLVPLGATAGGTKELDEVGKKELLVKEREKVQGLYELVKVTVGGHEIKGAVTAAVKPSKILLGADGWGFQFIAGDKVKQAGLFELDPLAKPKQITLKFFDDKLERGNTLVGIYSQSGDDLVLSFNYCNPNQPPANLSGSGAAVAVWHLKRVKTEKMAPGAEKRGAQKNAEPLPVDMYHIQGVWKVTKTACPAVFGEGQKDVELEYHFKGSSYQVFRNGKLFHIGSFSLGMKNGVKTIDMTEFNSPFSSAGVLRPGIYSLVGKELILVHSFGNPNLRPNDFNPENPNNGISYLKRIKGPF